MTNAEAIAYAASQEADIEARIAAGEIPPRPEGVAWAAWYETHLRCEAPEHAYFIRVRHGDRCEACVRRGHHSGVHYEVVRYEALPLIEFAPVEVVFKTATHAELDARAHVEAIKVAFDRHTNTSGPLPPTKRTPRRL